MEDTISQGAQGAQGAINLIYCYLLDGAYGPFGCAKLPYDNAWQGSPLPDTTAISSSSCPGDELLPDTKRVDDVPPVL